MSILLTLKAVHKKRFDSQYEFDSISCEPSTQYSVLLSLQQPSSHSAASGGREAGGPHIASHVGVFNNFRHLHPRPPAEQQIVMA